MAPIPDRDYHRLMAQIQYQQRCIAALEAENSELQRRLNDLRRGIGISVTVQGQTMSLTSPVITVVSQSTEPADPGITGIFPSMEAPIGTSYATNQGASPRAYAPPPRPTAPRGRDNRASGSSSRAGQVPYGSPEGVESPPPEPDRVATPPWLRDQPSEWPTLSTPHPSVGRAAPRGTGLPPESPPHDQFSTLAKLTGHHPAVHERSDQRQYPHGPTAFSDSFVLG